MEKPSVRQDEDQLILSNIQGTYSPDERFETVISEVEDYAIFLLDQEGNVKSWNSGAEKITGYTAKEIIGKSFKLFYPKDAIELGLPGMHLQQARTVGKVNDEGWRVKKNGHAFWGIVSLTAIHNSKGEVTGFLKVTKDLTEKKVAEDRYSKMLEELRLKNQELIQEEERYHKMVSEVKEYAIILLDVDGKILDWNKGAEYVKGYAPGEIIGRNFRLFYTAEDRAAGLPERLLNEAAETGVANHEGYRIRKDGTRFWGNVAITALHDKEGKLIGFSKVTKDLTDRKAAEERLERSSQELRFANEQLRISEERYQRMISEVQDYAILLMNTNGEIQNWNTGAQLIKGYTEEEIIGKNFKTFYLAEDIRNGLPDQLLQEAREKGKATSEGWRKRKDGSRFWASVVITALHGTDGTLIGFSKVTRDLSERKKSEDALKEKTIQLSRKNEELERLNTELTSFAYVVSHDFKEPIRKIRVFAGRQLEPDKSHDQIKEFSHKIMSSAERMQQLMESLLSYSRISNDDAIMQRVDLNDILSAVEGDLELLIGESKAVVKADKLPIINGIPFQLHQMFLNLISNSINFAHTDRPAEITIQSSITSNGQIPKELKLNGRDYHRLTFSDNGIGFATEQAARIFDVFKRLNQRHKGTGIGLAIVKRVALNHHGEVIAQGSPGEGARFDIFLPVY